MNLAELQDSDFETLSTQILEASTKYSENELMKLLGNALHDEGMTTSQDNTFKIIEPKIFGTEKINAMKSLDFVGNTAALQVLDAENEGRRFMKRFRDKLKNAICNNETISNLISGNGTLKDYLIAGIPMVLSALGLATLNPLALAIVAAVFALIVKVGFETYCEV